MKSPAMDPGVEERGKPCRVAEGRGLGIRRAFRAPPRSVDEEAHDQWGDVVEEKRRDRFVDEFPGPQDSGNRGPGCPAEKPEDRDQGQEDPCGKPGEQERTGRGGPRPHVELTFAADVDQPKPRRKRHCNRRQEQRDHAHDQLGESVCVGQRVVERVRIRLQRILACNKQDHREDPKGGTADDGVANDGAKDGRTSP